MANEETNVSVELLRQQLARANASNAGNLKHGGGGGIFDGMEARIKRLEDDAKDFRSDLKAIRIDLAEIKGRLSAMPSTWQMVGLIVAIAVGMFAVVRIAIPI